MDSLAITGSVWPSATCTGETTCIGVSMTRSETSSAGHDGIGSDVDNAEASTAADDSKGLSSQWGIFS